MIALPRHESLELFILILQSYVVLNLLNQLFQLFLKKPYLLGGFKTAFTNEKINDYQRYFSKSYFYLHFGQKRPKTGQNILWFTTAAGTFAKLLRIISPSSIFTNCFRKYLDCKFSKDAKI